MQQRKLVIDSAYYTIGEVLPRVFGFLLLPLTTRFLTPAEYGINSYTNTVMLFSLAISTLSLNTFLLRNYYKEDGLENQRKIIGNIFVLTLITNGLLSGLELLVFPWALERLKIGIPFQPYFFLAILINFLDSLSVVPLVVFRIQRRAKTFVLVNGVKVAAQFGVTYWLLMARQGLTGVYLARLFVSIPFALFFAAVVYRHAIFLPNRMQMRKALRFSLPLLPGVLSYMFISTFDRVVLEKNLGLSSLGLYSTAATLSLALNIIVQGLYRSFEQRIFEKHGTDEYFPMVDTLYRYFLTCLVTGGFLLSLFSREFFVFFTSSRFVEAYSLVPLLVVPVLLAGFSTFYSTLLVANHQQLVITRSMVLSLVVTVPSTLLFVRWMGVYGVILASALAFAIVIWYYLKHLQLMHTYVWRGLLLLGLLIGLSAGVQALALPMIYAIALKLVVAALYLKLTIALFRVKLAGIRKMI
jgi:O-antigen/teichoic acid export membrane protein